MKLDRNFHIERYGLHVRLVTLDDVDFILSLRTNDKLNKFIHKTSVEVKDQVHWLHSYFEREKKQEDYYFVYYVIEEGKEMLLGVNRIYNIKPNSFVVGSWIFLPDSPMNVSVLGDVIAHEIGFESFPAEDCFFDVRKNNHTVIKYHQSYKPTLVNEDADNYYYRLSKSNFFQNRDKYLKLFNV